MSEQIPLSAIAHGRSGDKGNHANVAVIAYTAAGFAWLREYMTVDVVTTYFAPLVTAGTPGVTGYTTGRPTVREVFAYWPALIDKAAVTPEVRVE